MQKTIGWIHILLIASLALSHGIGPTAFAARKAKKKQQPQEQEVPLSDLLQEIANVRSVDKDDPYYLVVRKVPNQEVYDIRKCIRGSKKIDDCPQLAGRLFTRTEWNRIQQIVIAENWNKLLAEAVGSALAAGLAAVLIPITASKLIPQAQEIAGAAAVIQKFSGLRKAGVITSTVIGAGGAGGVIGPLVSTYYNPNAPWNEMQRVKRIMSSNILQCHPRVNQLQLEGSISGFSDQLEKYLRYRQVE